MASMSLTQTQPPPIATMLDEMKKVTLYREPITTPGLIPLHLKQATVAEIPVIEVVQRFISHLKLGSGATVENFLALVALFKVVKPAWRYLKDLFLRFFGSRVSIPETDPVAQEIIQWMSTEVIDKTITTTATMVSAQYGQQFLDPLGFLDRKSMRVRRPERSPSKTVFVQFGHREHLYADQGTKHNGGSSPKTSMYNVFHPLGERFSGKPIHLLFRTGRNLV